MGPVCIAPENPRCPALWSLLSPGEDQDPYGWVMTDSTPRVELYEDLRLQRGSGAECLTGDDLVEEGRGQRSSL